MLKAGTSINEADADHAAPSWCVCMYVCVLCGLTTKAASGHRCIISGDVLQHHDASAVIPLYADPTRCVYQIHAACVFHIQRVTGERKSSWSVVNCHLKGDGHTDAQELVSVALDKLKSWQKVSESDSPCDPVG